jgi:signal transduction histidine kinase
VTVADPNRPLVRRAARAMALQTAGAVTLVLAVVGVTLFVVQAHTLHVDTEHEVRTAAVSADDVDDPPYGVVLLEQSGPSQQVVLSPGAPAAFRSARPADLPIGLTERQIGGQRYELYTIDRGGSRFTAALDLRRRNQETDRMFRSLLIAGLIGIIGAALVGAVAGRWATRPFTAALGLQRRFVADASHELRTPLAIAHLRAQMLRSGAVDTAAELDQLVADTRALGEVVEDLLLSAELGARAARGAAVDLGALANEVVASFGQLAAQRSVSIRAEVGPGPLLVRGVPAALRRAIGGLVDNALGHVPSGGHVAVRVNRRGSFVEIDVVDDGEGLDPATVTRLMDRFARGTTDGEGRRFGLGLALVREVVVAHDGKLTVSGAPGVGAEFAISLPAIAE